MENSDHQGSAYSYADLVVYMVMESAVLMYRCRIGSMISDPLDKTAEILYTLIEGQTHRTTVYAYTFSCKQL